MKCMDVKYQPREPPTSTLIEPDDSEPRELLPTHETMTHSNFGSFRDFERSDSVVSTMRERPPDIANLSDSDHQIRESLSLQQQREVHVLDQIEALKYMANLTPLTD